MKNTLSTRPRRLWLVAVLNTLAALLSLSVMALMGLSDQWGSYVRQDGLRIGLEIVWPCILVVASLLAIFRRRHAGLVTIVAALFFYGGMIYPNLKLLSELGDSIPIATQIRMIGRIATDGLAIGLNLWVFRCRKVSLYFARQPVSDAMQE